MAHVDLKNRAIQAKLVYYGPGLCGKTTNLEYVNAHLAEDQELMSLATQGDRTIFFDFMPLDLGQLRGMDVRFKLYTVPGQVRYNQTRKMVLKNVDGVVFVADSQKAMLDANLESLDNLFSNLNELGINAEDVALILQYNKRDLPDVLSPDELDEALNRNQYPRFLASAATGEGVSVTLREACKQALKRLSQTLPERGTPVSRQERAAGKARKGLTKTQPRPVAAKAGSPTAGAARTSGTTKPATNGRRPTRSWPALQTAQSAPRTARLSKQADQGPDAGGAPKREAPAEASAATTKLSGPEALHASFARVMAEATATVQALRDELEATRQATASMGEPQGASSPALDADAFATLATKTELTVLSTRVSQLPQKADLESLHERLAQLPTKADLDALQQHVAQLKSLHERFAQLPTKAESGQHVVPVRVSPGNDRSAAPPSRH